MYSDWYHSVKMWFLDTPTTCFGETLQSGALKLSQFCGVAAVGFFIIFIVDIAAVLSGDDSPVYVVISVLLALLSLIEIICNFLLYRGASTGNARLMKPWFWVYTVQTLLLGLAGLIGSIIIVIHFPRYPELSAALFVFTLVVTLVCKHLCFVVLGLIFECERGQTHGDVIRPVTLDNEDA